MTESKRKAILRLKEIKKQKDLSLQDIVELCEAQGEAVSWSTVRRIFARGSEDGSDFRAYTINAIFHAIVGTDEVQLSAAEEAELTDTAKEIVTENSALKAMVELNDKTISDLQKIVCEREEEIRELKQKMDVLQVKLDNTTNLFQLAMESLGRGSAK